MLTKPICVLSLLVASSAAAYADCKHNYSDCAEVVVYLCRDRYLGTQEFVGGSDLGYAETIALDKASRAGYDNDDCRKRVGFGAPSR